MICGRAKKLTAHYTAFGFGLEISATVAILAATNSAAFNTESTCFSKLTLGNDRAIEVAVRSDLSQFARLLIDNHTY
jgi:hypothetical protein